MIKISDYKDLMDFFGKSEISIDDILNFRSKNIKFKSLPRIKYLPIIDGKGLKEIIESDLNQYLTYDNVIYFILFYKQINNKVIYNDNEYYYISGEGVYKVNIWFGLTSIINLSRYRHIYIHLNNFTTIFTGVSINYERFLYMKFSESYDIELVIDKYNRCHVLHNTYINLYSNSNIYHLNYIILRMFRDNVFVSDYIKLIHYDILNGKLLYYIDNHDIINSKDIPKGILIKDQDIIGKINNYNVLVMTRLYHYRECMSYYTFDIGYILNKFAKNYKVISM